MSRKHFKALAESLNDARAFARTDGEHQLLDRVILNLSGDLAGFNSRFDRGRFLNAAGLGVRPVKEKVPAPQPTEQ